MTDPAEAAGLTGTLIGEVKLLSEEGQWLDSCRVAMLCAYLQNMSGRPDSALQTLQDTQTVARRHSLTNVAIWTAWGASAVCAQDGAFEKSAGYLHLLEQDLYHGCQWVLADLISLVRQAMLDWQEGVRTAPHALAFDQDEVGLLIQQMLRWGVPWLEALNQTSHIWSSAPNQNSNGHSPGGMRGLWQKIRRLMRGELRLRLVDQGQVLHPTITTITPCEEDKLPANLETAASADGTVRVLDTPFEKNDAAPAEKTTPAESTRNILIPISGVAHAIPRVIATHGNAPMPSLAVYCLGAFKVFVNNNLINGWNGQKGSSILKYLVANWERPIARDILMDMFWPDAGAEVARRNLHQAIYGLRQTLRRSLPDLQLILFENDCYRINPEVDVWMDFEEFERHVRAGRLQLEAQKTAEAMESFGMAELLYSGDFLEEELYESWPQSQREYFRSLYLEITAHISEHYIQTDQITPAMILCQKVLARDHCNERAYRDLILCHLLQGQRQLAIREYQMCVQALKEELGLPPSDEIQTLYRQIIAG